jgi:hypothetical protein
MRGVVGLRLPAADRTGYRVESVEAITLGTSLLVVVPFPGGPFDVVATVGEELVENVVVRGRHTSGGMVAVHINLWYEMSRVVEV